MSRLTLLCFAFATIIGVMTFGIKQKVASLEDHLQKVIKESRHFEEAMHILTAEWNYLNNPVRLQRMVEKHLKLVAGTADHLATLDRKSPTKHEVLSYDTRAMMQLADQLEDS